MGFFDKFIPKEITKPFTKVARKVIPKELRPALPFLAAAVPFALPGSFAIGGLNPALSRGIMSSLANIGSQKILDPEGELNDLSVVLAGLTGAGATPEAGDKLRGLKFGTETTKEGILNQLQNAPLGAQNVSDAANLGFFQRAGNVGIEGLAQAADFLGGARDTMAGFGEDPGSLFTKAGAKEAAQAAAVPLSQGTGDLAYATASAALREFNAAEAAELAQAGMDEAAIANARRIAIREAMEVSGFTEEDILETFDEIGLKDGGRVGYKTGKLVKEGLGALKLFRRPKYRFEDEAKMTLDLTKTGRYTEKQLLELDGDQIAEIYEYEGFTPPAPIEGSTKIIDMEEIMENIKNVTPEDKADGGITGLKDGGMLDFGGKEMDLRGGGFVPIGKKEKADDVPARLSKNEFVMTADAVRAAGGGSVNKGAQRMYDLMNNLEARA